MAVASLVLGILATLFAFIPLVGVFTAVPLGVMALIFGIVARRQAAAQQQPTGLATGGLILGAFGILLGLLLFASCVYWAKGTAVKLRDDPEFRRQFEERWQPTIIDERTLPDGPPSPPPAPPRVNP